MCIYVFKIGKVSIHAYTFIYICQGDPIRVKPTLLSKGALELQMETTVKESIAIYLLPNLKKVLQNLPHTCMHFAQRRRNLFDCISFHNIVLHISELHIINSGKHQLQSVNCTLFVFCQLCIFMKSKYSVFQ